MSTFKEMLTQSAKNLRESKAQSIAERLEATYSNEINSLVLAIKDLTREQSELILDMYPSTSVSNELGKNFNPNDFLSKDLDNMIKIREYKIKLELLAKKYKEYFDKDCTNIETIKELLK